MSEENKTSVLASETLNIKERIEAGDIVVLDTNIWLLLYEFFTDSADTAIDCLYRIKDSLYVPAMVYEEFSRHHIEHFNERKQKIRKPQKQANDLIDQQKNKMRNTVQALNRWKCPDVDRLLCEINRIYDSISDKINDYYEYHNILELLPDSWTKDIPFEMMEELKGLGHVLYPFSLNELLKICDEGEQRYKKRTPPGYMDMKDKDGLGKYGDLIIWLEVIRYSKNNNKNVIFVTDDIKEDWWIGEKNSNGTVISRSFRSELVNEFEGKTGQKIIPLTSDQLFKSIASSYGLHITEAEELAAIMTADNYAANINDSAFERIIDELKYSELSFVEEESLTHVGDRGVIDWNIENYTFVRADYLWFEDGVAVYKLTYTVEMSGASSDYLGRDGDEEFYSAPYYHEVSGTVQLKVKREVSTETDFELDNEIKDVSIMDAFFEESSYRYGNEDTGYYYDTCPDCGCKISSENDGGNGFCINCAPNH